MFSFRGDAHKIYLELKKTANKDRSFKSIKKLVEIREIQDFYRLIESSTLEKIYYCMIKEKNGSGIIPIFVSAGPWLFFCFPNNYKSLKEKMKVPVKKQKAWKSDYRFALLTGFLVISVKIWLMEGVFFVISDAIADRLSVWCRADIGRAFAITIIRASMRPFLRKPTTAPKILLIRESTGSFAIPFRNPPNHLTTKPVKISKIKNATKL
jgi:hypothetical protein